MAVPAMTESDVDSLARDIGARINDELPGILKRLLTEQDLSSGPLQFECSLLSGLSNRQHTVRLASVDITDAATPIGTPGFQSPVAGAENDPDGVSTGAEIATQRNFRPRAAPLPVSDHERAPKRRAVDSPHTGRAQPGTHVQADVARRLGGDISVIPQRKKRLPDNPNLQPSSLDKFIGGVSRMIHPSHRVISVQHGDNSF